MCKATGPCDCPTCTELRRHPERDMLVLTAAQERKMHRAAVAIVRRRLSRPPIDGDRSKRERNAIASVCHIVRPLKTEQRSRVLRAVLDLLRVRPGHYPYRKAGR